MRYLFGERALLVASVLTGIGCVGDIESGAQIQGDDEGKDPGIGRARETQPGTPAVFQPAPAELKRLTVVEYQNSVRDLLGAPIEVSADLELDPLLGGFSTIGAAKVGIATRAVEQYEAAAFSLGEQVFTDEARRRSFVGCAPATASDPCVRAFLEGFGRRAFRRPLAPEEIGRYQALIETAAREGAIWDGLEAAVSSVLQSPHFLFRVELGVPDGRGLRYGDFEMAARLSFFLWKSTPDDALLNAAARGELSTEDGVRAQARRLLAADRARPAVTRFFIEDLQLQELPNLSRDSKLYPRATPTIGASMRTEAERFVQFLAFDGQRDFRDVLTARETFLNSELERLYDLPPRSTTFHQVDLPASGPRAGLLGLGGVLSRFSHPAGTSPTLRGQFVRTGLLCLGVPPPPPGVETKLQPPAPGLTTRKRFEQHRTDPNCASCHELMDPIGFGLEAFDAAGGYRKTDNGAAIDATGDLDGQAFDGARELAALVREDPRFSACLATRLYAYAAGHVDTPGERPVLDELHRRAVETGFRFPELLVATVANDAFRYAAVPASGGAP